MSETRSDIQQARSRPRQSPTSNGNHKSLRNNVEEIRGVATAVQASFAPPSFSQINKLRRLISPDGRALFEYHVVLYSTRIPDTDTDTDAKSATLIQNLAKLWASLASEEQDFWCVESGKLLETLRDPDVSCLALWKLQSSFKPATTRMMEIITKAHEDGVGCLVVNEPPPLSGSESPITLEPDSFKIMNVGFTAEIFALVQDIRAGHEDNDTNNSFDRLQMLFTEDGWTLLAYHSIPFCKSTDGADALKEVLSIWTSLPHSEQSYWHFHTNRMMTGLELCLLDSLNHLLLDRSKTKSRQHAARIEHYVVTGVEKMKRFPVLDFFLDGAEFENAESNIQQILHFITNLIAEDLGLNLCGRFAGARIDFDPTVTTVTGISARLQAASHRSLTKHRPSQTHHPDTIMEWLLQALIIWNPSSPLFEPPRKTVGLGVKGVSREWQGSRYATDFSSCLAWLDSEKLAALRPFTVASFPSLMDALRRRSVYLGATRTCPVRLIDPKSIKPPGFEASNRNHPYYAKRQQEALTGKFNIVSDQKGFAEQLMHCFDQKNLTAEEYEDLVEQRLYALQLHTGGVLKLTEPAKQK